MNQNVKPILAYVSESEGKDYKISIVLNYVEHFYNIFNLRKFNFTFSLSSQSKNSLVL